MFLNRSVCLRVLGVDVSSAVFPTGSVPSSTVLYDVTGEDECVICFDRSIDSCFLPCRHVLACMACAQKCNACPICRQEIKQRLPCKKDTSENTTSQNQEKITQQTEVVAINIAAESAVPKQPVELSSNVTIAHRQTSAPDSGIGLGLDQDGIPIDLAAARKK